MGSPPNPIAVTVDLIALANRPEGLSVILIRRRHEPFRGHWALPGGFLEADEDLAEGASREMLEETGLEIPPTRLTQVGAYGAPGRDPRMRTVTIAFAVVDDDLGVPIGGDDADAARFWPVHDAVDSPGLLAFDHRQIIADALTALGLEKPR